MGGEFGSFNIKYRVGVNAVVLILPLLQHIIASKFEFETQKFEHGSGANFKFVTETDI